MSSENGTDAGCSDTTAYIPDASEYLPQIQLHYIIVFSICGALSFCSLALYIETVVFFMTNLHNWKPRDKAIWLLGVYPIFCCTSFIALIIPRSSTLNSVISSMYLSVCVYLFVVMLIGHYGGAYKMSIRLEGFDVPLASPPVCCCCLCLPSPRMTMQKLRVLQIMVLQYATMKPLMSYIMSVILMNGGHEVTNISDLKVESPFFWLGIINIISTLVALWGFVMVFRVSKGPLVNTSVQPKFICLQLVMVFCNFQRAFISMFITLGVIQCEYPLNAKANGDRWNNILLVFEMFIIGIIGRIYYRRHVTSTLPDELSFEEAPDIMSLAEESEAAQDELADDDGTSLDTEEVFLDETGTRHVVRRRSSVALNNARRRSSVGFNFPRRRSSAGGKKLSVGSLTLKSEYALDEASENVSSSFATTNGGLESRRYSSVAMGDGERRVSTAPGSLGVGAGGFVRATRRDSSAVFTLGGVPYVMDEESALRLNYSDLSRKMSTQLSTQSGPLPTGQRRMSAQRRPSGFIPYVTPEGIQTVLPPRAVFKRSMPPKPQRKGSLAPGTLPGAGYMVSPSSILLSQQRPSLIPSDITSNGPENVESKKTRRDSVTPISSTKIPPTVHQTVKKPVLEQVQEEDENEEEEEKVEDIKQEAEKKVEENKLDARL